MHSHLSTDSASAATLREANSFLRSGRYSAAHQLYRKLQLDPLYGSLRPLLDRNIALLERRRRSNDLQKASFAEYASYVSECIDPELRLPEPSGLGNDYTLTERRRQTLVGGIGWQQKSVSVIIPVSGSVEAVSATLASLCKQNYPHSLLSVVVVDCEHNDAVHSVFAEYASLLNLYLARPSSGSESLIKCMNYGAKTVSSDILLFLRPGDALPAGAVAEMMSYHHVRDDLAVWGLTHGNHDLGLLPPSPNSSRPAGSQFSASMPLDLRTHPAPFLFFSSSMFSVSRRLFAQIGGWDETINDTPAADIDFGYRMWRRGLYLIPHARMQAQTPRDRRALASAEGPVQSPLEDTCPYFAVRSYRCGHRYKVPLFSVYITSYNCSRFVRRAIDSVLAQTYSDFEVVVVDDGSTDASCPLLQESYRTDPRIRLYHKDHGGPAKTANCAIELCKGFLIVELDADDMLVPTALEAVAQFFEANPLVDCVYSRHSLIDEKDNWLRDLCPRPTFDRYQALNSMNVPHLRCFTKRMFYRIGGFDEELNCGIDYDFFLRASQHARIAYLNDNLYLRRIHDARLGATHRDEKARNQVQSANKHLTTLGLPQFTAASTDPTRPFTTFVYKSEGSFAESLAERSVDSQTLPTAVSPRTPIALGND
jgi:chondroitin synthase